MRVFIAYDLPSRIRKLIYDATPKYNGIKYVKPENMHLTIKFLGEVDDHTVNIYKEKLNTLQLKKLNARLTNVGFFPSEEFIRVIWIGVDANFDKNVLDALEVNDFVPHVTIGRSKRRLASDEIESFKAINLNEEFEINTLTIYKSELTPEGPRYTVIKRYELCD